MAGRTLIVHGPQKHWEAAASLATSARGAKLGETWGEAGQWRIVVGAGVVIVTIMRGFGRD